MKQPCFEASPEKTMAPPKPVRKAVFPVAGMGTGFLPATKAVPKEMLPVVDKPVIQYAVEEAREAGIEQFVFITGRGKHVIADHFDHAYELESLLEARRRPANSTAFWRCCRRPARSALSASSSHWGWGTPCGAPAISWATSLCRAAARRSDGRQAGRAGSDDGGLSRCRRRHHRGGGRKAEAMRSSAMAL